MNKFDKLSELFLSKGYCILLVTIDEFNPLERRFVCLESSKVAIVSTEGDRVEFENLNGFKYMSLSFDEVFELVA